MRLWGRLLDVMDLSQGRVAAKNLFRKYSDVITCESCVKRLSFINSGFGGFMECSLPIVYEDGLHLLCVTTSLATLAYGVTLEFHESLYMTLVHGSPYTADSSHVIVVHLTGPLYYNTRIYTVFSRPLSHNTLSCQRLILDRTGDVIAVISLLDVNPITPAITSDSALVYYRCKCYLLGI